MNKKSFTCLLLLLSLCLGACSVRPADPSQTQKDTADPIETTEPMITEPIPFSLYLFLSPSNYAAPLNIGTGELVPPGTLTDPKDIPQPEQYEVGNTLSLRFDSDTEGECIYFHYYHSSITGKELLVTIIHDEATRNPLLMVFEVDFGGADFFDQLLNYHAVFYGKILYMVNIDYVEGCVYARNAVLNPNGLASNEIIDLNTPGILDGTEYLGCSNAAEGAVLLGNSGESVRSAAMQNSIDIFSRIYARFGIDLDTI